MADEKERPDQVTPARRRAGFYAARATFLAIIIGAVFGILPLSWPLWGKVTAFLVVIGFTALASWDMARESRAAAAPPDGAPAGHSGGRRDRSPEERQLDDAAAALAKAVQDFWKEEIDNRQLRTGELLPMRLTRAPYAEAAPPTEPRSRLLSGPGDAVEAFSSISSRRYIIIGKEGTGKTSAAALLTLELARAWNDLTDEDKRNTPVPVFLHISGWKPMATRMESRSVPAETYIDWLCGKLEQEYRFLAAKHVKKVNDKKITVARALVLSNRILAVLDGLDEIGDPEDDPKVFEETRKLQAAAISKIAEALGPFDPERAPGEHTGLILTCRTEAFTEAARQATKIDGARLVLVQPPTWAEAKRFLIRRAPNPQTRDQWRKTLAGVRADAPLAQALSRQLFVSLADRTYREPGRDPVELLEKTQDEIRRHLLEDLIARAFPGAFPRGSDTWRPADAHRWLRFLAAGVRDRRSSQDITWWDLPMPRPFGWVERLLAGLVGTALVGGAVGLGVWFVLAKSGLPAAAEIAGPSSGLVTGGLMGVLSARSKPPPAQMHFGKQERAKSVQKAVLFVGAVAALAGAVVFKNALGALSTTLVAVPAAGCYAGVSVDATVRVANPRRLLRSDLVVLLVFALAYGVPIGLVCTFVLREPILGPILGLACALAGGLTYGLPWIFVLNANKAGVIGWVHSLLARTVAAGQLPWRLTRFLEDAHERTVLQQVGPVYRFRHAELQELLAKERAR